MSSDSDLDTSSYPCNQIELVDSNHIHMIQIILHVTLLYTNQINEDNNVILLSNIVGPEKVHKEEANVQLKG